MADNKQSQPEFSGFLSKETENSERIDELEQRINDFTDEIDSKQEELRKQLEEESIKNLQKRVDKLEEDKEEAKEWLRPTIAFAVISTIIATLGIGIATFSNLSTRIDGVYRFILPKTQIDN